MAEGGVELRPTRRQELADELRRSREVRGLSGRDLAARLGLSQSKVSRIESGKTIPTQPEVTAWAEAVEMSADRRDRLVELTEAVFTEVHHWRAVLRERSHIQDEIEERETRARLVRTFQPSVVPGLLQTAEYARRVISMAQLPNAVDDLAVALDARLRRQLAMYEEDRRFEFLVTEAALRWRPGRPKLLLAQLDRVASLTTLDNVSIGLVPLDVEVAAPSSHGFIVYECPDADQDTFVEVEMIHANLIINDATDVSLYLERWSTLAGAAVFDDDARALLASITTRIRSAGR